MFCKLDHVLQCQIWLFGHANLINSIISVWLCVNCYTIISHSATAVFYVLQSCAEMIIRHSDTCRSSFLYQFLKYMEILSFIYIENPLQAFRKCNHDLWFIQNYGLLELCRTSFSSDFLWLFLNMWYCLYVSIVCV